MVELTAMSACHGLAHIDRRSVAAALVGNTWPEALCLYSVSVATEVRTLLLDPILKQVPGTGSVGGGGAAVGQLRAGSGAA